MVTKSMRPLHQQWFPDLTKRGDQVAIDWRGIVMFTILVFGISWLGFAAGYAGSGLDATNPNLWTLVAFFAVAFGPAVAAFLMRQIVAPEGYASARLRWRVRPVFYLAAFCLPFVWGLLAIGMELMLGWARFVRYLTGTELLNFGIGLLIGSVLLFGEEFGWRSYLLEKLSPLPRWQALLASSAIWGLWHIPYGLIPNLFFPENLGPPLLAVAGQVILTFLVGLLIGWIYLTSGSVFPAILMHAMHNNWGGFLEASMLETDISYAQASLLWIAALVMIILGWFLRRVIVETMTFPGPNAKMVNDDDEIDASRKRRIYN